MSNTKTPKPWLDITVNLALIVTCAFVIGTVVQARQAAPTPRPSLTDGDQLEALRAHEPDTERTISLVVSPSCRFCKESLPFYQRLTEQHRQLGAATNLQAVVADASLVEEQKELFAQHGVVVDATIVAPPAEVKVPGVPAIIVTDAEGRVLRHWIGKLDEAREQEVLRSLRAPVSAG